MPKIQRPHSIVVKVTAEERDAFYRMAIKAKVPASNWLRDLGMVVVNMPATGTTPNIPGTFKNGDLVAKVPKEWGDMGNPITEQNLSLPENGSIAHRQPEPPKPQSAESRMYEVISKRQGKAVADAWLLARHKPKADNDKTAVDVIVAPHLKPFFDNLIKNQGIEAAKLWLLGQVSAKKISL